MPLGLNDEAFRKALLVGGLNILGSGAQGDRLGQSLSGGLMQGLQAGSLFQRQQKLDQEQQAKDKLAAQTEQLKQQALQQQMAQQQYAQQQAQQQDQQAQQRQAQQAQLLQSPPQNGADFAQHLAQINNDPSYLLNYQKNQAAGQVELAKAGLQAQGQQEKFKQQEKLQAERLASQQRLQKQQQEFQIKQQHDALQAKIDTAANQPEKLTAEQEKNRFTGTLVTQGAQQMLQAIKNGYDPTKALSGVANLLGPWAQGQEHESFNNGADIVAQAYALKIQGTSATDEQIKAARNALIPRSGESDKVKNQKLHTIATIMNTIRESGKLPDIPGINSAVKQAGGASMATQGASGTLSGQDLSEYDRLRKAAGY